MNMEAGSAGTPDLSRLPFDSVRLDRLLEEAGIDVVVVCSRANIQYLLGGYRFFFFDHFDAMGPSRYLPLLVYQKGHPERSAYFGNPLEGYERDNGRFWVPTVVTRARGSRDAMALAVEHIRSLGKVGSIGVERAFVPADAEAVLTDGMAERGHRRCVVAAGAAPRGQDGA